MERKWVIVAFGDVIGFGPWIKRALNDQESQDEFLKNFFAEIWRFTDRYDCYLKHIGDGVLILKELPEKGHKCEATIEFLQECYRFTAEMNRIVKRCAWPSPDGFRLRVVAGNVRKISRSKSHEDPEYIGYAINLAERLLSIKAEIPCICHESVISIIGKKRGIEFRCLGDISEKRRGVDSEDINALWSFKLPRTNPKV